MYYMHNIHTLLYAAKKNANAGKEEFKIISKAGGLLILEMMKE